MKRFFRHRGKLNNKGFSLVELIIAFSILSIVAITVVMVMSAGSNMFTNVDREINLQYKSQTAMAQFQQYFMGCSKAICATDDSNVTYFADGSNVYAFRYSESDGKIYFASAPYTATDYSAVSALTADSITEPFCSDVSNFAAVVSDSGSKSVKIFLTLTDNSSKSYETSQIFTFRNSPVYISELSAERVEAGETMLTALIATLSGTEEGGTT